jgi:hypothetical protein
MLIHLTCWLSTTPGRVLLVALGPFVGAAAALGAASLRFRRRRP